MTSAAPDVLPADDLIVLRRQALERGQVLLSAIESAFGIDGRAAIALLGSTLRLPVLSHATLDAYVPAFDVLGYSEAAARNIVLLRHQETAGFVLALTDPLDVSLQAQIGLRVQAPLTLALIHPAELATYLAQQEQTLRAVEQFVDKPADIADEAEEANQLDLASIGLDASPAVRTVNSTLFDALKAGVSDIHFEASAAGMAVKYRLDGVLLPAAQIASRAQAEQIISRIKVLAELDIAERRVPQDGKFRVGLKDRRIDIRVSVMPSVFGEDAVLRILDRSAISQRFSALNLEDMGFFPEDVQKIRKLSREPYGMLLVTGPTGSGKTTTLYAAISEIHTGRDKIITIEDPVEYHLEGVLQIPVNEKKGLTFARGLRSILRHDPDKILVGEIRDTETAQIAIQSALTGHAVFTTVHANNALDVVGRVVNMGIDAYSFLSALNGIVGQRLIRRICPQCAEPDPKASAQAEGFHGQGNYRIGVGCPHCRGTGYRGRRAVAEIVAMDDALRAALLRRESHAEIKQMLQARGIAFLRQQAQLLAAMGETTLDEVDRVTLAS